ncbi:MAG: TetR/AcrR family transcriptional regulator [bacterium]|nr:TetR/AcrR family transcriptional regulator [bacterium]
MKPITDPRLADGRALRSERSRRKIVDALFDLVGEGHLMPTAKQVAERADLGIRTVFRHFADMDSLFEQMNERLHSEVLASTRVEVPEGSPAERLTELIRQRCQLFERVSPYWKASEAQRSRSAFLTRAHQSDTQKMRANLFAWLPEFRDLPNDLTDALEMVVSIQAWHHLRTEQKLNTKRAVAAMQRAANALCAEELG